jgi:6-phosphogluconolactonase
MNRQDNIYVFDTTTLLFETVARQIVLLANEAVTKRGRFSIALSGGSTPGQLHALLATAPYNEQIPWEHTYVFWGDERCVPLDDERNNALVAKNILLNKVALPTQNIFITPVNLPPAEAAATYDAQIRAFFGAGNPLELDLIFLGLGDNGHTASLFPGTSIVHETSIGVKEIFVEEVDMFRVTMTAAMINAARHVAFLVTGTGKAEMLEKILYAPFNPDIYPAQLIQPSPGDLHWYVDKAAAALITHE